MKYYYVKLRQVIDLLDEHKKEWDKFISCGGIPSTKMLSELKQKYINQLEETIEVTRHKIDILEKENNQLNEIGNKLDKYLSDAGITEDELLNDFDNMRGRDNEKSKTSSKEQ